MNGNEMRIMNWMPLLKCKNLRALALRGNYIKRFDELQDFVKLENLIELDLRCNPLCLNPNYRRNLFNLLPNLTILDGQDRDGIDIYINN